MFVSYDTLVHINGVVLLTKMCKFEAPHFSCFFVFFVPVPYAGRHIMCTQAR